MGLQGNIDVQRQKLDETRKAQEKAAADAKALAEQQKKEIEGKEGEALEGLRINTEEYRGDIEKTERERLKVEENFFANQNSIAELQTSLNEATGKIEAAKKQTGLEVIRNPQIARTADYYNARIGVVQAAMAAREGQIATAFKMIDRTKDDLDEARKDKVTYFKTVLDYYGKQKDDKGNEIIKLDAEEKAAAEKQIKLIEDDMKSAQAVADTIKDLMITDPMRVEGSGITLNDTPDQITKKLAVYDKNKEYVGIKNTMVAEDYQYLSTMADVEKWRKAGRQVVAITGSDGTEHFFLKPLPKATGGSNKTTTSLMTSKIDEYFTAVRGTDNKVSPEDWNKAKSAWIEDGGNPTEFDTKFKGWKNPNNKNYDSSEITNED
jgi:hypothetical protein